jgi:hypothetical protein
MYWASSGTMSELSYQNILSTAIDQAKTKLEIQRRSFYTFWSNMPFLTFIFPQNKFDALSVHKSLGRGEELEPGSPKNHG